MLIRPRKSGLLSDSLLEPERLPRCAILHLISDEYKYMNVVIMRRFVSQGTRSNF